MAVGLLGAVVWVPIALHTPHASALVLANSGWHGHPGGLEAEAAGVIGGLTGGLAPDLDESHALLARQAERAFRWSVVVVIGAAAWWLHVPLLGIAALVVLGVALFSGANRARQGALGLLIAGLAYGAYGGFLPPVGGLALAFWALGALLTGHRTCTHSLAGLALWGVGAWTIATSLHQPMLADAAILGYALHLAADIPSGGVPLFWPWHKRQGGHVVATSGSVDHLVGALALCLWVLMLLTGAPI